MKNSINFFAMKSEVELILEFAETQYPLKYIKCGLFQENRLRSFYSWKEIPDLGVSLTGDLNFEPHYLTAQADSGIIIEEVPQRKGGIRYSLDQFQNPDSVVLKDGGFHQESGSLIASQLGTISNSRFSQELFKLFYNLMKKRFKKKNSGYFLSNEANHLLESGARLTSSIKSPQIYDLKKGVL